MVVNKYLVGSAVLALSIVLVVDSWTTETRPLIEPPASNATVPLDPRTELEAVSPGITVYEAPEIEPQSTEERTLP